MSQHPKDEIEVMIARAEMEAEMEATIDKEVAAINQAGKLGMNRKTFKGKGHGKSALPLGDSGSNRYGTLRLHKITNEERRKIA